MELIKAAPAIWFRIRPASQSRIAVHGTDYASRFFKLLLIFLIGLHII